ncbi:MAG TPA: pyridoxamine 5'-phosphate oxidase family protein [Bryobacteraceae bacterium]|nr:pyridoxamine 5'-phosphate oxidase family protein [Bryobacteraceae bacterium]
MEAYSPTERTQVRRRSQRGTYDKAQVHAILDEGFVCHVGFVIDGQPCVIPTAYGRMGETIYVHGSPVSRLMRGGASQELELCLTVTLIDGLVLARSAFHTSINYRSVVVYGIARPVTDLIEKREALRCVTNHVIHGRWEQIKQPTEQELKATSALALPIEQVSAKIRTGPPIDDEEDYALPVWGGVAPLIQSFGQPIPDSHVLQGLVPPQLTR